MYIAFELLLKTDVTAVLSSYSPLVALYNTNALSGTKCGVFVGCGASDYHQLSREHRLSAQGFTGGSTSILAARISYLLNLQGPCLSIDTACSSSLVALATACDNLVSGNCNVALAGGVGIMATPAMHIMTAQAGMLSQDGKCHTFDQNANGFVPGEAVGVVMLKRLADAERDNDRIYGVIQGWGVNQDGKTNGITAPNATSQASLEAEVYEKFNIDPAQIQLIEAHGTGTKLGDPIEVDALKQSFKKYTNKETYCALGSVKSNIGHTMWAAGVSGFLKVILALQQQQLPPTINYNKLNEHIILKNSPFYVNDTLQDWNTDTNENRQAAISSFGFSGTNAHMVLAEYVPQKHQQNIVDYTLSGFAIPLAAKNKTQLLQKVNDLITAVESTQNDWKLEEIAYTLQVGREPMETRVGFITNTKEELLEQLKGYAKGDDFIKGMYVGDIHENKDELRLFAQDEDLKETIVHKWIHENKLSKLLELWVKGLNFDWNLMYGANTPKRIGLPLYPFAQKRYWFEATQSFNVENNRLQLTQKLHPLVHKNTSDFTQQQFTSTFTGEEFFLRDHQVKLNEAGSQKVLPGVAYLEMAQTAVAMSLSVENTAQILELHDVVWMYPIAVETEKKVTIVLFENEETAQIDFEIRSVINTDEHTTQEIIHCKGQAGYIATPKLSKINLNVLEATMNKGILEKDKVYPIFAASGLEYGEAYQGIEQIHIGENEVLATVLLPEILEDDENTSAFELHPSIMDSVFQSTIGLITALDTISEKPSLPFLVESLRIYKRCTEKMVAWIRKSSTRVASSDTLKVDIDICDDNGNICIQIQGFIARQLQAVADNANSIVVETASKTDKENDQSFDEIYHKNLIKSYLNDEVSLDDILELV